MRFAKPLLDYWIKHIFQEVILKSLRECFLSFFFLPDFLFVFVPYGLCLSSSFFSENLSHSETKQMVMSRPTAASQFHPLMEHQLTHSMLLSSQTHSHVLTKGYVSLDLHTLQWLYSANEIDVVKMKFLIIHILFHKMWLTSGPGWVVWWHSFRETHKKQPNIDSR